MVKGRKLPPLLPLEYCRIDRAARMLDCEVDDIFHWQEVGAISLFTKLDNVEGKLFVMDFKLDSKEDLDLYLESCLYSSDEIVFFNNGYSRFEVDHFPSETSKPYVQQGKSIFLGDTPLDELVISGYMSGLWRLVTLSVKEIFNSEHQFLELEGSFLSPDAEQPIGVFISMPTIDVMKGDLWITRPDIEKLYESITTGEPLTNIHNNTELAQRAKEQEAVTRTRAPRTSHPQSEMIRALLLLHPHITEDLLTTPHKLHGVLTEMFKASNGKSVMPDVHPNTFERWLKASTNS